MVLGDNDGNLHYFANTGSATNPQFALTIPQLGGFDVGDAASPFLYDLDGDGDFDLVVGVEAGNRNLIRNTGSSSSASWSFETSNFGGINVKGIYGNGFSTPVVFPFAGRNMMVVGSRDKGLVIADSLEQVVSNPLGLTGSWDTGTQSSTGNDLTPMGSGKRTGRNQILVKASELKAKGLKYGKITSLGFEVSSTNNFPLSNGVTFGMKQANLSSLDGFETGFTEVYNGVGSFAPGWNDITLQNPFTWDGVSDLVIQVCFSRNIPNTTIDVYLHDAGFNANAFGDVTNWNTNAADGCQMPYKNSSTLRPNFRLGFVPSFRENAVGIVRGEYLAPAIGYLTQDSIPELLLGNVSGGVEFFTSEKLAGSLSQPELPLEMAPVFLAWPNPAQQNISVRLMQESNPKALIRMLDVQGRVVYQKEQFEIIQTHALPALPAGIYILEVSSGKDLQREKWIIKR